MSQSNYDKLLYEYRWCTVLYCTGMIKLLEFLLVGKKKSFEKTHKQVTVTKLCRTIITNAYGTAFEYCPSH